MRFILLAFVIGVALTACDLSKNGRCGSAGAGGQYCTPGAFCSKWQWCGVGPAWQAKSAQSKYNGDAPCRKAQAVPATRSVNIKNVNSGKYIDVAKGVFKDGTNLRQWDKAKSKKYLENQIYNIVYLSKDRFQIVTRKDQKLGFGAKGNSMVVRKREKNAETGTFTLVKSTRVKGAYFIKRKDGKCLDVARGSRRRGANIIFWNCKKQNDRRNGNQLWRFENVSRRLETTGKPRRMGAVCDAVLYVVNACMDAHGPVPANIRTGVTDAITQNLGSYRRRLGLYDQLLSAGCNTAYNAIARYAGVPTAVSECFERDVVNACVNKIHELGGRR